MIFWSAISLLVICGVFISPSKEAGVWVIERRVSTPRTFGFGSKIVCWISIRSRTGYVTFSIIDAQMFFSEDDAKREIQRLGLSSVWSAVEKGGSQ